MQTFYEFLFKAFETKDPYRDALIEVTNANSAQMNALKSERALSDWSPATVKPSQC